MNIRKNNISLFLALLIFALLLSCSRNTDENPADSPYVVILSIDGCRWDYPDIHNMINLKKMGQQGVKAEALIPSYPTKTFPNHYTMVTGLYPDHHGIVSNNFYDPATDLYFSLGNRERVEDPRFWGGEPIWETAEKQGIRTASFFWVGSETSSEYQPSIRKYFDDDIPFETRVDSVVSWLYMPDEKRPHLILFYFEEPDGAGHRFGPESAETTVVLAHVDSLIGVAMDEIEKAEDELGIEVNFIVTSDHGMGYIPADQNIFLEDYIDLDYIEGYSGSNPSYSFKVAEGMEEEVYTSLSAVDHLKVWTRDQLPEHYNYGTHPRIFDLIVEADGGWGVRMKRNNSGYSSGTHGYDPDNRDMHAIFYAKGPAFKSGYTQKKFQNVSLYPLLAEIMKLNPASTDGNLADVMEMLKN